MLAQYVLLVTRLPREFRGLGAKEKYEALCEQSEQNNFSIWELTPDIYC